MKQNLKKGRVEGSVLFTVITVMLIMVVFLMSTLILTTSANRRSYYTYFESQSQYAAQAALSAVTNSAYTDEQFHEWLIGTTNGNITVNFDGSDIQFTNGNDSVTCLVEEVPPNYIWDDATQAIHAQRSWRITATASVGNGRNASEYTVCNYIYENFHIDDPELLDTVQNSVRNNINSWTMSSGSGTSSTSSLLRGTFSLGAAATNNNFVSLGPQYSGMTNVPLGRIRYDDSSLNGDYIVNTANDNYAVGDIMYVNSVRSAVLRSGVFQRPGESAIYYGNLYGSNKGNGGFRWMANIPNEEIGAYGGVLPYNALPYVYVDGRLISESGGGFYIGYGDGDVVGNYPVNLFCGGVSVSSANENLAVYGDAYLYDPEIDSFWGGADNFTELGRFIYNNVTQSNSEYGAAVGGNLICNNNSLTLGVEKPMVIEGDLIYTNPNGMLSLTNNVTVNGRVISAAPIYGLSNLTCTYVITPTSYSGCIAGEPETMWAVPDGYDSYESYYRSFFDSNYAGYTGSGYDTYCQTAGNYGMPLFPFNYRLDEINEIYYRWDLQATDPTTAATNAANDPFVRESIAAGHVWETTAGWNVREFTQTVADYEIIRNQNDPRWDWSLQQQDPTDWSMYCKVKVGEHQETYYVPYTTPVNTDNIIISKYEPISPDTAATVMTGSSSFQIETVGDFATLMTNPQYYNNENRPDYHTGVPIIYHDSNAQEVSSSVDAYVITDDCYIDLNSPYNEANILIDPRRGGHSDTTTPLCIVFQGRSIANCNINIIVNNTANYSTDYSSATSLASDPANVYAGRREVFIFFEDGFGAMANAFRLYCSGAYGQVADKYFRVVSNPIYPDSTIFDSLASDIKYSYELVPNTVIFGEVGGVYSFANAALINAEMLMANSTINNTNASNYKASVAYREEYYSNPYITPETSMVGLGTVMCSQYNSGSNVAMTAYIGDANRNSSPPSPVSSTQSSDQQSSKLGQDYQDYFSNHHQGAS